MTRLAARGRRSDFKTHALTLLAGTGLAQALPIATAPILSRMYGPREFGLLATFVACSSIMSIFATGRYEIAILLPREDKDARGIVDLAIALTAIVSVILALVLFPLRSSVSQLFSSPDLSHWLFLVPVMVLLTGVYQSLNYWFNRRERYRRLAVNRISRSTCTVVAMLVLGRMGFTAGGLIVGTVIGQAFATATFAYQWRRGREYLVSSASFRHSRAMARRYKNFVIYSVPGDTINGLTQQMPVLVLGSFFGPGIVGFYNFTQRVLSGPEALVAVAVGDVYRQRAAFDFAHQGNCRALWLKTFKVLLLLSVPPFLLLALISPAAFAFCFGEEWRTAGEYARLLVPFFMLSFTASILSRTLHVAEKQRQDLLWQVGLVIVVLAGVVVGGLRGSPTLSVLLFSLGYSMMYGIYLLMSFRYSGGTTGAPAGKSVAARQSSGELD
jgi:O-antigen/teichoic acid export membrane protein